MSELILDLLGELQTISDKMDRMGSRRREAESELTKVEERLEEARGELSAKHEEHHAVDMERRKKELLLKNEKERQQRIKGRVGEVKTSREYQAVLAETNSSKQAISGIEEGLLKDMEALEALAATLKKLEDKVAGVESDAAVAREKFEAVRQETDAAMQEGVEGEKAILAQLPPDVVSKYKLIRSRLGGVAVAQAKAESCTACFMRIPPQRFNEVMRGKTVVQCPNCYRILIPAKPDIEQG